MYNVIQENAENTVDHDAGKINGRFGIVPSDKTLNIKGQIQMLIQKGMVSVSGVCTKTWTDVNKYGSLKISLVYLYYDSMSSNTLKLEQLRTTRIIFKYVSLRVTINPKPKTKRTLESFNFDWHKDL